jgi:hypothetical protein
MHCSCYLAPCPQLSWEEDGFPRLQVGAELAGAWRTSKEAGSGELSVQITLTLQLFLKIIATSCGPIEGRKIIIQSPQFLSGKQGAVRRNINSRKQRVRCAQDAGRKLKPPEIFH